MAPKCRHILTLIITVVVVILLMLSTQTKRRQNNPRFVFEKPKPYLQTYSYLEFGASEEQIVELAIKTYQEHFWNQAQRKNTMLRRCN